MGPRSFTTMGNFAPAMGMMGTLIGLVKMLMQMDDPSSIGPAMAVALITTFYGVILANLVFLPAAGKLKTRSAAELTVKQLIINGVLSVQSMTTRGYSRRSFIPSYRPSRERAHSRDGRGAETAQKRRRGPRRGVADHETALSP